MHPAYSVIFFTTASGAGYGLLFLLGLGRSFDLLGRDWWFGVAAMFIALTLVTLGLLSSTLHLGRPERAWRAFSQWRSSWLSREGVAAVVAYIPALVLWAAWMFPAMDETAAYIAGIATAFMAFVTVFCTAKIYSSLVTIRQWKHPLVSPVYLVMALASGAVLLLALARLFDVDRGFYGFAAIACVISALLLKLAYWLAIDRENGQYTMSDATGLGKTGSVRQWEAPHTAENFVMKEMGYTIARKHAAKLRSLVVIALLLTLILLVAAQFAPAIFAVVLTLVAVASLGVGLAVERWLFFAEAQHVSMLYYGAERA